MSVLCIKSTDPGAPLFTATAGGMCSVLDYILVTRAGWELAFTSGATKRVYRPVAGMRHYLRVEDGVVDFSITGAATSDFETMSNVDTGTNEARGGFTDGSDFHCQGQNGTGPHPWIAVVDDRTFTFLNKGLAGPAAGYELLHWGDLRTRKASDPHRTILCARSEYYVAHSPGLASSATTVGYGWVTPRNAAGTFGPYRTGNWTTPPSSGTQGLAVWTNAGWGIGPTSGDETYPGLDNLGVLSRIHIGDPFSKYHIGWCRGLWVVKNPITGIVDRDVAHGWEDLAGRTFLFVRDLTDANGSAAYGPVVLEISDTWDQN